MLSDAERNYTWNAENRLILEEPRNPSDGKKAEFLYDYMGRRVRKTVFAYAAGTWTQESEKLFVYDGWNLIEEIADQGGAESSKYYVWGLDLSQSLQGAGGIGGLICSVDNAGNTLYYLYDGNGNVGQLVKPDGSIAAHYEYDPFGNQLVADGTEAEDNPFRFSTKYHDAETGLYYYGFRYYFPEVGRWVSCDPAGEYGGINLYGFITNNTINLYDIIGLWTRDGVLHILCKDSAGKELVQKILSKSDVYSFKSYSIKRQFYEDAAKTKKKGEIAEYSLKGYHTRFTEYINFDFKNPITRSEIAVDIDISDQEAASVFFHESVHASQKETMPYKEKEYEAFIKTAKFNLMNMIPPTDPSFRKKDTYGNEILDVEAIRKWLDKEYGFSKSEHFTEFREEPKDKKGPITGWCCQ